jgi:small subunit ribosomal protein S6
LSTAVKRLYEGLFLVSSNNAASDWNGVIEAIEKILKRSDAEIVSLKKWDDRRLCYPIQGTDRGTYILVYFNVDPLKLKAVERDVQLSENIMRVMFLRTDKMTKEDMEKHTPLDLVEIEEQKAAKEAAEASSGSTESAAAVPTADDSNESDQPEKPAEDTE